MESVFTQKAARVLRVLMLIALGCNLIALFLVPTAVLVNANDPLGGTWTFLAGLFHPGEDDIQAAGAAFLLIAWAWCWATPHTFALTAFLLCSGCCTAQILRQGLRVVDTILQGKPFSMDNAVSLRRAAVCSFVISGAALARTVFSVCYYRSVLPLVTYNALFVPIFAMAGLLCLVMSALFHQAAEMKAENDLTI